MSHTRVLRAAVVFGLLGAGAIACSAGAHNDGFVATAQPATTASSAIGASDAGAAAQQQPDATLFGKGAPTLPSTGPNCSTPTSVGCPCATIGGTNACTASGCATGSETCLMFGEGETAHAAWGPCSCVAGDAGPSTGDASSVAVGTGDAAIPDQPLTSQNVCANPDAAQLNAFLQGLGMGQIDIQFDAGPSCCIQCTGCVPGSVIWSYDSCIGAPEYCVQTIQQTCQPDGTWGPSVETGANYTSGCIHFWDGCDLNDGAGSYAGDCDGVFAGCNAPLSSCPGSSLTNDFGNADPLPPEPQ